MTEFSPLRVTVRYGGSDITRLFYWLLTQVSRNACRVDGGGGGEHTLSDVLRVYGSGEMGVAKVPPIMSPSLSVKVPNYINYQQEQVGMYYRSHLFEWEGT